jgi:hypothetical protein
MRVNRLVRTASVVPIAVSRKTGATDSWIVLAIRLRCGSGVIVSPSSASTSTGFVVKSPMKIFMQPLNYIADIVTKVYQLYQLLAKLQRQLSAYGGWKMRMKGVET